ncbi:hypothetical protein N8T08_009216 [Aspergillus melleus]|uniref:Uncharacterized protein n=1 Tax=Aspergillus melleus TaxID=138277 RepID=A0ACC3ATY3_9EURO|nr:hypothetical protein N8T08_009216 [Aspergillus melleus]
MANLVSFTPTQAEKQLPLVQQYIAQAKSPTNCDLREDPNRRGRSGSQWTLEEVQAVRAVPLLHSDVTRIVPELYFPEDNDDVYRSLELQLRVATIDDLKEYEPDNFDRNEYKPFFERLSELCQTETSENTMERSHRRNTSAASVSSGITELSTSSNENSGENVSSAALQLFVSITVSNMKAWKFLNVIPAANRKAPRLKLGAKHVRFNFTLGGVEHDTVNDGQILVDFPGTHSHSDRGSLLSVASLECKPRNAGGLKRGSGEQEAFSPRVFAQEVAELIGAALAQHQSKLPIKHQDQEQFVIALHGTVFSISAAYFPPEYFGYLQGRVTDRAEIFLWVRRSVYYDLKKPDDRIKALQVGP